MWSKILDNIKYGRQIESPEFLRESDDKLTQEQKRLSRKSSDQRIEKAAIIVAKVHRKSGIKEQICS